MDVCVLLCDGDLPVEDAVSDRLLYHVRGEDGVRVWPDLADIGPHVDEGILALSVGVGRGWSRLVLPALVLDLQVGRGGGADAGLGEIVLTDEDWAALQAVTPGPQEGGGGVTGVTGRADVRHRQAVADADWEPAVVGPDHPDGGVWAGEQEGLPLAPEQSLPALGRGEAEGEPGEERGVSHGEPLSSCLMTVSLPAGGCSLVDWLRATGAWWLVTTLTSRAA